MHAKTVVFDFDSTLVDCESLDMLAALVLEGREDSEAVLAQMAGINALGMSGAIPYGESLARRMALFSPTVEQVAVLAAEMERHITPAFLERRDFFARNEGSVAIVSGGFDEFIMPVAAILGIPRDLIFANAFVFDDSARVVGVDTARATAHAGGKSRVVDEEGLARPLVIVGDGWTDAEVKLAGSADMFVAFTQHVAREPVMAVADAVAASVDELFAILETRVVAA